MSDNPGVVIEEEDRYLLRLPDGIALSSGSEYVELESVNDRTWSWLTDGPVSLTLLCSEPIYNSSLDSVEAVGGIAGSYERTSDGEMLSSRHLTGTSLPDGFAARVRFKSGGTDPTEAILIGWRNAELGVLVLQISWSSQMSEEEEPLSGLLESFGTSIRT